MLEFLVFSIVAALIDSIWIIGAYSIHTQMVVSIQKSPLIVSYFPVLLFYILASTAYISIIKRLAKTKLTIFLYGMLLGLLMYGTFDLTNKAIFTHYPWWYAIADTLWGSLCMGLSSVVTYSILS